MTTSTSHLSLSLCVHGGWQQKSTKSASSDAEPNDVSAAEDDDDEDGDEDLAETDVADRLSDDVEGNDPNHEHLSAHTKSLIAHLASLPGFGQTRARISYVPYTAPEPTGITLAELQLPWRSSSNDIDEASGAASSAPSPNPSVKRIVAAVTSKLRNQKGNTVSLDRRRGTNRTQLMLGMCSLFFKSH